MTPSAGPPTPYILDGEFLLCQKCQRWMEPSPNIDGTRAYACGPPKCVPGGIDAAALEENIVMAALLRAGRVLCPDFLLSSNGESVAVAYWNDDDYGVDPDEAQRWQECDDLSDRRALVRTAWVRIEIDPHGQAHAVWH